ncbi:MAG: putative metal-binding motif-containing protein [Byssovorax sp.]
MTKLLSRILAAGSLLGLALGGTPALASTGVCDSNQPTSTQACIDAIQNGGSVINDIFKDSNGLTGPQLPVFGTVYNQWPGCDGTSFAGCSGQSQAPFDCPGQYACNGAPNTIANASTYLNHLDRLWWHPCRLADHSLINGCPNFTACVADGSPGNYIPWEGIVFDLGGPANKVAIFAQNDHGPQPCESTEYTVYLSDNPLSHDMVQNPKVDGVNPMAWNRAVLSAIYTKGWIEVRPPDPGGHAACGDTPLYSVEEDSFVSVYALPCGITFKYAAIVAGNDGLDFPACGFDSTEAELDAVAGLTESGAAVCPDADGDHFVDCNCPGAPPVCDCNDADMGIHPGAPEACDSPDLNCDGTAGGCAADLVCYQSLCIAKCGGENPVCPSGASCSPTDLGKLCVPLDCTQGGCPPGGVCEKGICVPACTDVSCPVGFICQDGHCIDPCEDIQCPAGQTCQGGSCLSPCNCFSGDIGCMGQPGTTCDVGDTNLCVPILCKDKTCNPGEVCDPATGNCVSFCNDSVKCPSGEKCVFPDGCVPICSVTSCDPGLTCNPMTGKCEDLSCANVTCILPLVCVHGDCVEMDGGAAGGGGSGTGGEGTTTTTTTTTTGGTGGGSPEETGGCGCRVAGDQGDGELALGALFLAAACGARRRRRPLSG